MLVNFRATNALRRWKFLRRASKQDCPSSNVLPLLYSTAGQHPYMRARVNRASELICHLRAAWCRCIRDSRHDACAPKKEQEDRLTGASRRRKRHLGSRLIMWLSDVASCIPSVMVGKWIVRERPRFFFLSESGGLPKNRSHRDGTRDYYEDLNNRSRILMRDDRWSAIIIIKYLMRFNCIGMIDTW